MARPPNTVKDAAKFMGRKIFTGETPCLCGCDQFYTSNGACVECTKAKARARYATPEGRLAQREGDRRRYREKVNRV